MKILFLSSIIPSFKHYTAGSTVLASLIQESSNKKNKNDLYILNNKIPKKNLKYFSKTYLHSLEYFYTKKISNILRILFVLLFKYDLNFSKNKKLFFQISKKILNNQYDLIILFWDTEFEYIVPYLNQQKIYAYLAVPPYSALISRIAEDKNINFVKKILKLKFYKNLQRIHIKNLKNIHISSNICNVNKSWYKKNNIKCKYVPNCWPNPNYLKKIKKFFPSKYIDICSSIGGLNATGNYFGFKYLLEEIIPRIKDKNLRFNIFGRGSFPEKFNSYKNNTLLQIKGFVRDIDKSILRSRFCLILNNAYKNSLIGGYTRVIYYFSMNKCLVAHKNLRKSMPELKHNFNCLLGSSPKEIIRLLKIASDNDHLRKKIELNAYNTYIEKYTPNIVFNKILSLSNEKKN